MKKLLIILLTTFISSFVFSQSTWTIPQGLGGSSTMLNVGGGFTAPKGVILGNFTDTATANLSNAKWYNGSLIRVNTILHLRYNNTWLLIGKDSTAFHFAYGLPDSTGYVLEDLLGNKKTIIFESIPIQYLDSITVVSDSLFQWIGNVKYFVTNLATASAGGDTTIFQTVLDSTGNQNNRLLFSRNNKISSNPKLLTDSANTKVVINHTNVSVGGPNTKLYVKGNVIHTGTQTIGNVPTSDDTTYKPVVMGADGVVRKRTNYVNSIYTPMSIPFAKSTGILGESNPAFTYNDYGGVGPRGGILSFGMDGDFGTTSSLIFNNSNGIINATGNGGVSIIAQGGGTTDITKRFRTYNNGVLWMDQYTTDNSGTDLRTSFNGIVHPITTSVHDFGTSSFRWKKGYFDSLDIAGGTTGQVLTKSAFGSAVWQIPSSGWGLTGNAITPATDFLGTTNNTSLRFRSNNSNWLTLDSIGDLNFKLSKIKVDSLYNIGFGYNNAQPSGGYSNFFGYAAGSGATNAPYSNFFGVYSGLNATNATGSNFFGNEAGNTAVNASGSNFFGQAAGSGATDAGGSNFFGQEAGAGAAGAYRSNFFGYRSGWGTSANHSNFFGFSAGNSATNASGSNFFGTGAGSNSTNASFSNFFGAAAGTNAPNASFSNFFGEAAGDYATNASSSNFIGTNAGRYSTGAAYSNFFGAATGQKATGASYSNFFGYRVGDSATHIITGANNILIGTNITTPAAGSTNMASIGNVLYLANTHSTLGGNPSATAQTTGQVGINVTTPAASAYLDITGTAKGFLPPRMTTSEMNAISSPATGLVVFNTTDSTLFEYRGLSGWSALKGTTETASNGLTKTGNDIQLGGTLTGNTTINTSTNTLIITNTVASTPLVVSSEAPPASFSTNPATFPLTAPTLLLHRTTSGTSNDNLGTSIDYYLEGTSSEVVANQLISKFTDATNATATSEFVIKGVNNGSATANLLTLAGNGVGAFYKGANVASAGTITATGNLFHVTGTTNITSVSGTAITAGSTITIIFDDVLTFTDGSNLKLNGNFVTTADDTITLSFDGTNFYEITRSTN